MLQNIVEQLQNDREHNSSNIINKLTVHALVHTPNGK